MRNHGLADIEHDLPRGTQHPEGGWARLLEQTTLRKSEAARHGHARKMVAESVSAPLTSRATGMPKTRSLIVCAASRFSRSKTRRVESGLAIHVARLAAEEVTRGHRGTTAPSRHEHVVCGIQCARRANHRAVVSSLTVMQMAEPRKSTAGLRRSRRSVWSRGLSAHDTRSCFKCLRLWSSKVLTEAEVRSSTFPWPNICECDSTDMGKNSPQYAFSLRQPAR